MGDDGDKGMVMDRKMSDRPGKMGKMLSDNFTSMGVGKVGSDVHHQGGKGTGIFGGFHAHADQLAVGKRSSTGGVAVGKRSSTGGVFGKMPSDNFAKGRVSNVGGHLTGPVPDQASGGGGA